MTLKEFRKLFVDITGRFDLVRDPETYDDAGANFFIQAGHRLLNSRFQVATSESVYIGSTEKGKQRYSLDGFLSVKGVQIKSSDSGWVTLEQKSPEAVKELSGISGSGLPHFFAVVSLLTNVISESPVSGYSKIGIWLAPVPQEGLEFEITGRFGMVPKKDSDTSFWLMNYPEIAVSAAQYQIEIFHRNTQGANDHLVAIDRLGIELEHDKVESEFQDQDVMNDSFKFRGKGNAR